MCASCIECNKFLNRWYTIVSSATRNIYTFEMYWRLALQTHASFSAPLLLCCPGTLSLCLTTWLPSSFLFSEKAYSTAWFTQQLFLCFCDCHHRPFLPLGPAHYSYWLLLCKCQLLCTLTVRSTCKEDQWRSPLLTLCFQMCHIHSM